MTLDIGLAAELTAKRHGFPQSGRLIWPHALSSDFVIEQSTHPQRAIPDHLGIHAEPWPTSKQTVRAVALPELRGDDGGLAVGCGHDNQLEQVLDIPTCDRLNR